MIGWLFGGVVKKFERAAKDVIQESSQEISNLFDHKLKPLADQFDYVSQQRLQEIEDLETQTKVDIENLLNHANDKVKANLQEINQLREQVIKDSQQTISQTNFYLENRINQLSLAVTEAIAGVDSSLQRVENLENQLFADASQLIDKIDELTLVSHASGMDYRNLQQLLSAQNWKDADKETYSIMLKISERENVCWLDDGDIRKFPRYDLRIINQLWVRYSDGKFGFSIQKQILQNHKQFTARCGWIENLAKNELIKYEDYNFTLDANRGHLPSTPRIVGLGLRNTNEITHRLNIFYSRY